VRREQKISGSSGGFAGAAGNDFRFGVSTAALGDFDGDGTPDVAVGAHRASRGGIERGAVWLCFLKPDGTVKDQREISSVAGGFTGELADHDRFGVSVCSLGDLDGDGTTDLAVGSYRDDDGGSDVGAVWILFLDPDGSVKALQKISALEGGFPLALRSQDSFGWAVKSIGDLDGDGVPDLAIGSSRDDNGESLISRDYGALYLCFLRRDGTVRTARKLGAGTPLLGPEVRPHDRFGSDVCPLGDLNGDGIGEIAVGAFADEPGKVGRVWVLGLRRDGSLASQREIGLGTGGFTGALDLGDRFGMSLAADDLDGDGVRDLFIGAAGDDDGGTDTGAIWACLLSADGSVRAAEKVSARVGGFGGAVHTDDWFGVSCATLGDVDGDGVSDLAVGAYRDDEGGYDRGAAWVLFRWGGTDLPAAEFAAVPSEGPGPLSVAFTDRSAGLVTSWRWDFGDGALSSARHPLHTYTIQGSYPVTLTVGGPLGPDELTRARQIAVQSGAPPVANFQCSPTSGEPGLLARFQDLSTGGVTAWLWDFGDGSTSTLSGPEHAFAEVGTYDVSLTVSGPGGVDIKIAVDLVTVREPAPVAAFSATPTSGPAPLAVSFTDQSRLNVTSWSWNFGDGSTASARHPLHVYAAPGRYTVALVVTSAGGTSRLVRTDLVNVTWPPPDASFSASPTDGPAPLAVAFTDQSTGTISSWSWDFGDGTSSRVQHPVHVYTLPDRYKVTLTVTGPGGTDTRPRPRLVSVTEAVLAAEFVGEPTSGTRPLTVNFVNQSTGTITSHAWTFGDGGTSSLASPSHTYTAAGSHTVTLTETGPDGTSKRTRASYVVVNEPAPVALFTAAPTSGIAPLTVSLTDRSTGPITTWSWDFGDGATSSVQHPVHVYAQPGRYTVMLTVAGPGGSQALRLADLVQVAGPPQADFTGSPLTGVAPLSVSFRDLSSGTVTSWEWHFGDGTSSRLQHPPHVYRLPGTYTVRVRTTGPGGSDSMGKLDYIRVVKLEPLGVDAHQSPRAPGTGGTVKSP